MEWFVLWPIRARARVKFAWGFAISRSSCSRRRKSARSLPLASSITSKCRPAAVSRRNWPNAIGSIMSAWARSCGSTHSVDASCDRPCACALPGRSWASSSGSWARRRPARWRAPTRALRGPGCRPGRGSGGAGCPTRRAGRCGGASSKTSRRLNVRSSFSITSRARAASERRSRPASKRPSASPCPLPTCRTTTRLRAAAQRVQQRGLDLEVAHGARDDRLVLRVQDDVLAGMAREADVELARRGRRPGPARPRIRSTCPWNCGRSGCVAYGTRSDVSRYIRISWRPR